MINTYENAPSYLTPLTCSKSLMSLAIAYLTISFYIYSPQKLLLLEWTLMLLNTSTFSTPIIIEPINSLFSATILFISSNVLMFSKTYMTNEKALARFTHILIMFVTSMNILVMSPNIMSMMLGWDGLGITSFLLVIFFQNHKSLANGMLTISTNRLGDVALLISIAMLLPQGDWNTYSLQNDVLWLPPLSILILLAAMTKSAQTPFSSWLPAAMAAPTPVSTLVHSSTLVTAGVFILIRFYPSLSITPMFKLVLLLTGSLTMFFGGLWATTNLDMKLVVALSTLSQLGFMMTTLGLGMVYQAFFHLITHAMFKALLFMSVGLMILAQKHLHFFESLQTMKTLPSNMLPMAISLLSMNAFPFLAGFFSKEMILETTIFNPSSNPSLLIIMSATMLTSAYSTRLFYSNITHPLNSHNLSSFCLSDNKPMLLPLANMMLSSTVTGSFFTWMNFLPFTSQILMTFHFLPMLTTLSGVMLATLLSPYTNMPNYPMNPLSYHSPIAKKMNHMNLVMGGLSLISSSFTTQTLLFSTLMSNIVDQGWLEMAKPKLMLTSLTHFSLISNSWTPLVLVPLMITPLMAFPTLLMLM